MLKKRNILILGAIAGIAIWELQIRPSLPWWVKAFTPLSNETVVTTCKASIDGLDWQKIKDNPPSTLTELEALIGSGCPQELGGATWEALGNIFRATTNEDGELILEFEDEENDHIAI